MSGSARVSDLWVGICCCHVTPPCIPMVGPIISGSVNTISSGLSQSRLTDMTIGLCGHPGFVISGSPNHTTNSLGSARVGDTVTGCNIGVIATGNPTHNIN